MTELPADVSNYIEYDDAGKMEVLSLQVDGLEESEVRLETMHDGYVIFDNSWIRGVRLGL